MSLQSQSPNIPAHQNFLAVQKQILRLAWACYIKIPEVKNAGMYFLKVLWTLLLNSHNRDTLPSSIYLLQWGTPVLFLDHLFFNDWWVNLAAIHISPKPVTPALKLKLLVTPVWILKAPENCRILRHPPNRGPTAPRLACMRSRLAIILLVALGFLLQMALCSDSTAACYSGVPVPPLQHQLCDSAPKVSLILTTQHSKVCASFHCLAC
jgi:hypothetical protein